MNFYGYFTGPLTRELEGNEEATEAFIRVIYEKYIDTETELRVVGMELNKIEPTVNMVGFILESMYGARKVTDDPTYRGLDKDAMVNFEDIVCMYRIDDIEMMNSLYTCGEKEMQKLLQEEGAEEQNKNMYHIILESLDGSNISGYTTQGGCIRINAFMYIVGSQYRGTIQLDLSDSADVDYLVALWWAGFIDEPLPFCAR